MKLLNRLARKFSSQASVSGKGGGAEADAVVVPGGTKGAGSSIEEERVDYSCPTLKDVSVKGGRYNSLEEGRVASDAEGGGSGVGGSHDGAPGGDGGCDGGYSPSGSVEGGRQGGPDIAECAHDGNENEGDRSVSSLAHAAKEGAQMDMRSEMDTMSIGSASEMASDDAETCAARFQSVSTKRDRVASMVAELEREERDVGSSPLKFSALVKKYNDVAVGCMEGSSMDQSLVCLLKAEKLLENAVQGGKGDGDVGPGERLGGDVSSEQIQRLQSMTYNNLGCLYRRMDEPETSVSYLQKALMIEMSSSNPQVNELASTHLNLSASYSVLHKDVEALRHGERAIVLLQGQLWPGLSFRDGMEKLLTKIAKEGGAVPRSLLRDAHVLSMAYHNVGTQNERLGRIREAQVSFNRAVRIGEKILGPSDRMTVTLQMNNRMFLQRYGGVAKSSGLQRSRSGVSLSKATLAAGAGSLKSGSSSKAAHARTKPGVGKGKK